MCLYYHRWNCNNIPLDSTKSGKLSRYMYLYCSKFINYYMAVAVSLGGGGFTAYVILQVCEQVRV